MENHLDFFVDALTNSIERVCSGESFDTDVISIVKNDLLNVKKITDGNLIGGWSSMIKKKRYTN